MASNKFTVINKAAMVLIAYNNGAVKTYPKNAHSLVFDPKQVGEDKETIYIVGTGSPTKEFLADRTSMCKAIIDEVEGTTPAVAETLNGLYLQLIAFFFRELSGPSFVSAAFNSEININGNYMMVADDGNIILTDGGNHKENRMIILRIPQEDGRTFTYPVTWILKDTSEDYDNVQDNLVILERRFDITYITIITHPVA